MFVCLSICSDSLVSPRLLALRAAGLVSKTNNVACVLRLCIGGFPPPPPRNVLDNIQAELLALPDSETGKEVLKRIGIEQFDTASEPRMRELLKWLNL